MFRQGRDEFVLFFNKRPRFVSTPKPRAVFSIIHSGLTWAGPPDQKSGHLIRFLSLEGFNQEELWG